MKTEMFTMPFHGIQEKVGKVVTWNHLESKILLQKVRTLCSKDNTKLRVSYNLDPPFFEFNNNDIAQGCDPNSIEGVLLQAYIDRFNLDIEWIDEEGYWGSADENGTFNGVVGRVSKAAKTFG